MRPGTLALLVIAGSGLTGSPGLAQDPADLSIQVGECIRLETATERYRCYERQVDAAIAKDPAKAGDPEAVPNVDEDGALEATDQPLSAPAPVPSANSVSPAEAPRDREGTVSTITALSERMPDQYVVTLENGQVWQQVGSDRYHLRVGDQVRIYPTRWGNSYRLAALDASGFIQVQRVR